MDFSLWEIGVKLLIGLVIGFSIGLTGIGGGVLILPSLTLILGMPPSIAVGTSSLYAFLTKIYAGYKHFRLGTIDFPTSWLLLLTAVPANFVVSVLINRYINDHAQKLARIEAFQAGLRVFISIAVLFSAALIIFNLVKKTWRSKTQENISNPKNAYFSSGSPRLIAAGILGIVLGALLGSTSIGGAVLVIPMLILVFGLSAKITVGTSIWVSLILTFVTTAVYFSGKQMDVGAAVLMAFGSLAGVNWGSKLSTTLPENILQGVVACVVLIAGGLMLIGS
jgi:uncharacterized membrane protein YfcA